MVHFHCLEIFVFNTLPSLSVFCGGIVQTLQTLIYTIRNRKSFQNYCFHLIFFFPIATYFYVSLYLIFQKKKKLRHIYESIKRNPKSQEMLKKICNKEGLSTQGDHPLFPTFHPSANISSK